MHRNLEAPNLSGFEHVDWKPNRHQPLEGDPDFRTRTHTQSLSLSLSLSSSLSLSLSRGCGMRTMCGFFASVLLCAVASVEPRAAIRGSSSALLQS